MRASRPVRSLHAAALIALGAVACATSASTPPPRHVEEPPPALPPPRRVKLAVLPIESDAYPQLAKAINLQFHDVQMGGIDDYFVSRVTLEVVQLSIECVDPTNQCFTAVGKSLASDKLLLAQLMGPTRKHDRSIRVSLTLFDVESGAPVRTSENSYKSENDAVAAVHELLERTITEGSPPNKESEGEASR